MARFDGTDDDETYVGTADPDFLYGKGGNDTLSGAGGDDIIYGDGGDDVLSAGAGRNTLDGGAGDDRLYSTGGVDDVDGGDGYDSLQMSFGTTVTFDDRDRTFSNGSRYENVEGLSLYLAGHQNILKLSTGDAMYVISAGGSELRVDRAGTTDAVTYTASQDGFSFLATIVRDSYALGELAAGTGDDTVNLTRVWPGNISKLDGGAGIDLLHVQAGDHASAPVTFEVADDGTITSNLGTFSNFEVFAIDVIESGGHVRTGVLADRIAATGSGYDLSGGGGDDLITVARLTRDARAGNVVSGDDGNDLLTTGDDKDTLYGGAGDDVIRAGGRSDWLDGGVGNDRLTGGAGADRLTGGIGADTFAFAALADLPVKGRDTVRDFHHAEGDRIDLSGIDTDATSTGDQAFTFIGSAAFSGSGAAEIRIAGRPGDKLLIQADLDHDGKPDFTILVHADTPLVAGDFVL